MPLAPFGYRYVPDSTGKQVRIEDPAEQAVIQRVRDLWNQGHKYEAIARILDEEKHPCRGRYWQRGSVVRIVNFIHGRNRRARLGRTP